jgi:hypothetical protein
MEAQFDIRRAVDRHALSAVLPTIDGVTFQIPGDRFIALLARFAEWLQNPDWLIYRYGAFLLGTQTRPYGPVSLPTVIELADRLERLSEFPGFCHLLNGFRNVTQFHDALFESRVAALFVGLPAFRELAFAPEYSVRGSIKRPDFRVIVADRMVVVEAKVPRLNGSKASRKFKRDVDCISTAMREVQWPSDRRLEIEVTSRGAEPMSQMAQRIVTRAVRIDKGHFAEAGVEVHVIARSEPFATSERGFISHVLFGENRAVSPFKAPDVNLRVVNNVLFNRVSTRLAEPWRTH